MPSLFAISWDWITQNLEIVLPIVLFLIFNVFGRSREDAEETPPQADRRPMQQQPSRTEPADGLTPEQRAEQIREEIRRRIQERMGQRPAPPPVPVQQEEPEPAEELPSWLREETPEPEYAETTSSPPPIPAAAPVREERPFPAAPARETMAPSHGMESFTDQFRQLEDARKLAASTAMQIRGGSFPSAQETRQVPVGVGGRNAASLRNELKDREGARRALVLREILDAPVSLRR